ncbi:MAG: NAD-dependent DNA ligase LigA [Hespellia sp.]|nr:NAD-dependent DNA ligase LigA [Hespellia sp.]
MNQNKTQELKELVATLNEWRDAYYNHNDSVVSDTAYDQKFDELKALEKETGIIFANSPTQTVGYPPVSKLAKVIHPIPLLSLDKTKLVEDVKRFIGNHDVLFMLKLDGLTTKLVYENGVLLQATTRGDGEVGEDITHNIPAFLNVPLTIPYQKRLVITGESFIRTDDFEMLKQKAKDDTGKEYRNGRNFASGSVRSLDSKKCKGRKIRFIPFNILDGLDEAAFPDSRCCKLDLLETLGFQICPYISIHDPDLTEEKIQTLFEQLKISAASQQLPIDGIVTIYDSFSYSKSCGRTGHHYKNGIAFKFEDELYETVLRHIEWTPSRFGELAPVAIFDTIEMDGCEVSRATLHNLAFIKNLELYPGCRIMVSKRNMIIPQVEDNLDRGHYTDIVPPTCPCCGSNTRIQIEKARNGKLVERVHCPNPLCGNRIAAKFTHFACQKAMNIENLSTATLEKLLYLGYLQSVQDLYHLGDYRDEIVALKGFGVRSFQRLLDSIENSRNTTFVRFLVAMDIPMIGRTKSRILDTVFHGSLAQFELAALGDYDFTELDDFGNTLNQNIHLWFADADNVALWNSLQEELHFEERKEEITMTKENTFTGCTIVATGKLNHFTRDEINNKILELGAKPGSSVTQKTSYLICGEKAGSKLTKAQSLGVPVLTEDEFLEMIA